MRSTPKSTRVAAKLAALPPLGLAAIKQIIRTSWSRTLDEELDLQRDEMRRLGFTEDYREGVAAFLEKRPAEVHRPMIISYLHKFIFVAIPKTGTHSVRQALREHMGPEDLEQVGLFVQKRFPVPELARDQAWPHQPRSRSGPICSEADFDAFFKFAFVRNPFDRFVSYCAFMTRAEGSFDRDPQGRHAPFPARTRRSTTSISAAAHVRRPDSDGKVLADYVGRVEQMQQSYDEICQRIGITSTAARDGQQQPPARLSRILRPGA